MACAEGDAPAPNPFAKSYMSVEVARNFPVSYAQNRFAGGPLHPVVGYRHDLDEDWMMGVGGQFKMLRRDGDTEIRPGGELALWTISHETYYIIRLLHPTYLLVGPRLHYLVPTNAGRLPLQRASEYETEIGAALSAMFVRVLDERSLVTIRLDRWRGTRTTRFQGMEVAAGFSWAWGP